MMLISMNINAHTPCARARARARARAMARARGSPGRLEYPRMQYSRWLCCCISGNSGIRFQWKFSCFLNNAHIRVMLINFSM